MPWDGAQGTYEALGMGRDSSWGPCVVSRKGVMEEPGFSH